MRPMFYILVLIFCYSCGSDDPTFLPPEIAPEFSMDALSVKEGETDQQVFINLKLSKSTDKLVTVVLETVDQSAREGVDYIGFEQVTIFFEPGDVQESCEVTIKGDEQAEGNEQFLIRIKSIDNASRGTGEIAVTIENDDFDFTLDIPDSGFETPESYDDMNLIWSDEFDGTEVDQSKWVFEIGNGNWGWGNNELEFYRKENAQIFDGHLIIQAREENFGGFNYTSTRMKTQNKFVFTHGRVDIRAALPKGQGIWPALWMLGENITSVGWPRCGEIDIMELLGQEPSKIHGTVHYPDPNGERLMEGGSKSISGGDFSDEFHVFSLIWDEDAIHWYLNDQKFHTETRSTLGTQNPYPFNAPFFFIFNVAVGGNWPGSPDGTTVFPQNMIVDYIRVFQDK